jgi:Autotransporter beta-domain
VNLGNTNPHILIPVNLTTQMNQLRDFAMMDAPVTTQTQYDYPADGKAVADKVVQYPVEVRTLQRWGIWASLSYYHTNFLGRGVPGYEQGVFGVDYRLSPHWVAGLSTRLGYINARSGLAVTQGGAYTAFYQNGFYGVAGGFLGPNQYTLFSEAGYDWRFGVFRVGPVANIQWDDETVNNGFGIGDVIQPRVGGRIAYNIGPIQPTLQVMWQGQFNDNAPQRANAAWIGAGLNVALTRNVTLFINYSFEGNSNYQTNQANLGARVQF